MARFWRDLIDNIGNQRDRTVWSPQETVDFHLDF